MSGALEAGERRFTERFEVAVNYDGWRLDRFLTDRMKRASRAKVARIIKAAARMERADGSEVGKVKAGTTVRHGDVVLVDRIERGDPATPPLSDVVVLHEGPDLVVLAKPAGMLVHRTAHEVTRTVDAYLAERYPGERVEPAHRIDRDTSGVLVCGRGLDAIRALVAAFEDGDPEKEYRAVVSDPEGRWADGASRRFETPLGFAKDSAIGIRIGKGDWECATTAIATGSVGPRAELRVRIERGRQHQIRAHLSLFGTPVVGDKLYGMGDAFFLAWLDAPGDTDLVAQLPTRWHCLHAAKVTLPWHGLERSFEAPLPPHWPAVSG